MRIYDDENLRYYAFRNGPAADHAALLTCEELDRIEQDLILQDADGDGYSADYINDLFAYDFDYILQMLGYKQDPQTCDILRGDDCLWRFHVTDITWDIDDEDVKDLPTEDFIDIAYYNDQEKDGAEADIAEFDKLVKEEREEDHLYQTDYYMETFDEQNHTFSVWEDGAYCEDHFCARIETKIIH